jgi:hypothetical protein
MFQETRFPLMAAKRVFYHFHANTTYQHLFEAEE